MFIESNRKQKGSTKSSSGGRVSTNTDEELSQADHEQDSDQMEEKEEKKSPSTKASEEKPRSYRSTSKKGSLEV